MLVLNGLMFGFASQIIFYPDFAFGCTHNCLIHLKVALSISLIVIMELFFFKIGPFKTYILQLSEPTE
jgi:hypothetical protein